jgi:hypothetical protein
VTSEPSDRQARDELLVRQATMDRALATDRSQED